MVDANETRARDSGAAAVIPRASGAAGKAVDAEWAVAPFAAAKDFASGAAAAAAGFGVVDGGFGGGFTGAAAGTVAKFKQNSSSTTSMLARRVE